MNNRLHAFLIAVIVLGIAGRFVHADWKLYTDDESVTSLRAAGQTLARFDAFVMDGATHTLGDLDRFERPGAAIGPGDVWRSLAAEDSQHPPLFYLVEYAITREFGDAVYVRRLPAVVFGILAIAAAWWCGRELFGDDLPAWILAALVAISPMHVVYAQDAREYSYWICLIFASTALLVRTLRHGRPFDAVGYALSVSAGLWGDLLFAFVAFSHVAYLCIASEAQLRARLLALAGIGAGVIAFIPWLRVVFGSVGRIDATTPWEHSALSPLLYAAKLGFSAMTPFSDLAFIGVAAAPIVLIALVALIVSSFAARTSFRTNPSRYAVALGAVPLALVARDLAYHQTFALQPRYLTPTWIALEIMVTAGISAAIARSSSRRLGYAAIGAFALCGAISIAENGFASWGWIDSNERYLPEIASRLAASPNATIVFVDSRNTLLELAAIAPPSTRFALHRSLDLRAVSSARDAFAITRRSSVEAANLDLVPVPLSAPFPPTHDPLVGWLKARAASDRGMPVFDDQLLFAPLNRKT